MTVATLHRATSIPRAEGAFSRCAIFTAFWVFSAFKMRVYLGRIVELDREPTCEVGPELAIYRSVTGCDERRGRRGEQAAPFASAAFRQSFPAAISVALGPRSVGYRRTSAAARGTVLNAFAAPKLVELIPSPRNAEAVGSTSRDAKTVAMAHELDRSFARSYPGSSATGVQLLATSRRDFVLTKAVNGLEAEPRTTLAAEATHWPPGCRYVLPRPALRLGLLRAAKRRAF